MPSEPPHVRPAPLPGSLGSGDSGPDTATPDPSLGIIPERPALDEHPTERPKEGAM